MPETGDLIGPYRLVSQLGRGAMGEVWRARDERLDRYVALKILPPDLSGDVERRARMVREARAAAAIKHPCVVTLFDIVGHRGDDILVMELVEGRTLSETLRKDGRPPLERALVWIENIADALVAAHARKILHRDIKAANVMVDGDDVKVLDFGLAKLRDEQLRTLPPPVRTPQATSPSPAVPMGAIALDETMPSEPATSKPDMSLDATLGSDSAGRPSNAEIDSYRTHVGQLLGTPLYMAPEQVDGAMPDERSEVFSVGVLAHEILAGKPPYQATSMDELFTQIKNDPVPPIEGIPDSVEAIVQRALAKRPEDRYPSMEALRDAVAAERRRRFAPPARKWPLVIAAAVLVLAAGGALAYWLSRPPEAPSRPGDEHVARALEEYDVFYNDKARSSLRAALARAPEHPRALAYLLLFGGATDADRDKALAAGPSARAATEEGSKDRALLDAALALAHDGPAAARKVLTKEVVGDDRELAFWAAELDYRAARYQTARDEYAALLASPDQALRGRIYDHDSSVLLYLDEPAKALEIGKLYRDAFPGEADAVGVYATTLAAAGHYDQAIEAAEQALQLSEGEDTLAGLGKVLALAGKRDRAKTMYRRSLERAGPSRRPIRRAALALLQYMDGEVDDARATVAPCLAPPADWQADPASHAGDSDSDAAAKERGACLFVAGVIEPERAVGIADQLDRLAAEATPQHPAYGAPASLAALLRIRAKFFGGGCIVSPPPPSPLMVGDTRPALDLASFDVPLDFYAAYHVPFFATWATCEKAAFLAAGGDRAGARKLLIEAARGTHRPWLLDTAKRYE